MKSFTIIQSMNVGFIKRYVFFVGFAWSLICVFVLYSHLKEDYRQTIVQAQIRAKTMLERDVLYRDWVASHGGVYVTITDEVLPNPHLKFLPERDIETTEGSRLTLVNPSYMTHQAFEMDNRLGETVSKLTSLKFINPKNAPDDWEKAALSQLESGKKLVSAVVTTDGESFVRTIRPFYVENECLKCHADQGYNLGDVRGGLSISIPFETLFSGHLQHNLLSISLFALLWVCGLAVIVLLGRKLHDQTCVAIESDKQLDQVEMSLNFMSNYDRRTNLPNRFKFEELMFDLFNSTAERDVTIAVTTVEVRNYKQIIDNFDHPVGDALFRDMAERLVVLLSHEDSVARFGEDRLLFSFVTKDNVLLNEEYLQCFQAELSKPVVLESHEFFPVVCMGTALYPQDAGDVKRIFQRSVSALTYCLENKRSGVAVYSQSIQEEAMARLDMERGLREALEEEGFELYLQPQVDITGKLIGAEALLRWQSKGAFISPVDFIPVAEESGLILPIGDWVLETAAQQAAELYNLFKYPIPVGVNVSAKQFQNPFFVDHIDKVLSIEGVTPELLEIEITESTFIEDIDRTIEILTDLKVRGLKIAIDDFGTGYSSLSYLNRFPVDRLKIDRSFVTDIAKSEDDRVLVSLIAEMGRKLGLNVIAEGVEDDTQKNLLVGMGCHSMQGFLFSRPLPFEEFCKLAESLGAIPDHS